MLLSLRSLIEDFPVTSSHPLTAFWAAPFGGSTPPFTNGAPWAGHDSVTGAVAGTSSSRVLIHTSGIQAPTVGAAVNGRVSAYFDSTASEGLDPTTLALSAYWRASYAGPPWAATSTAGVSGATGALVTQGLDPTVGSAVNGYTPAVGALTAVELTNATDVNTGGVATTTAWTIFALINVANADIATGNTYDDAPVLVDSNVDWGLTLNSSTIQAFSYDGAYRIASATYTFGAWYLVIAVFDGASIQVWANGASLGSMACGTLTSLTGTLTTFEGYGGAHFLDAQVLEIGCAAYAFSATDRANLRGYVSTRYALSL